MLGLACTHICTYRFLFRDGILYSLSNTQIDEGSSESVPRNLPFFEVLHEFIYRLAAQDRIGKHGMYVVINTVFPQFLLLYAE